MSVSRNNKVQVDPIKHGIRNGILAEPSCNISNDGYAIIGILWVSKWISKKKNCLVYFIFIFFSMLKLFFLKKKKLSQ